MGLSMRTVALVVAAVLCCALCPSWAASPQQGWCPSGHFDAWNTHISPRGLCESTFLSAIAITSGHMEDTEIEDSLRRLSRLPFMKLQQDAQLHFASEIPTVHPGLRAHRFRVTTAGGELLTNIVTVDARRLAGVRQHADWVRNDFESRVALGDSDSPPSADGTHALPAVNQMRTLTLGEHQLDVSAAFADVFSASTTSGTVLRRNLLALLRDPGHVSRSSQFQALDPHPQYPGPLIIAGHGMGGAFATALGALVLADACPQGHGCSGIPLHVVTFGAPLVFGQRSHTQLEALGWEHQFHHMVLGHDLWPRLPLLRHQLTDALMGVLATADRDLDALREVHLLDIPQWKQFFNQQLRGREAPHAVATKVVEGSLLQSRPTLPEEVSATAQPTASQPDHQTPDHFRHSIMPAGTFHFLSSTLLPRATGYGKISRDHIPANTPVLRLFGPRPALVWLERTMRPASSDGEDSVWGEESRRAVAAGLTEHHLLVAYMRALSALVGDESGAHKQEL